jgi:hypothetical protein
MHFFFLLSLSLFFILRVLLSKPQYMSRVKTINNSLVMKPQESVPANTEAQSRTLRAWLK